MKDARDPGTVEMTLAPKRGRGRPSTGKAKSAAERMREYRARSVTVNRGVLEVALGNASQVEALSFQVDGMDQLAEENRQLRSQVEQLRAELANVTRNVSSDYAPGLSGYSPLESALAQVRDAENYAILVDNTGSFDEDTQGYLDSLLGALACAERHLAVELATDVF